MGRLPALPEKIKVAVVDINMHTNLLHHGISHHCQ